MQVVFKTHTDAAGVLLSRETQFWFASEVAAPPIASSVFVLDDVNWPPIPLHHVASQKRN